MIRKNWLYNVVMPGKVYRLEWFGGRLTIAHKQIVWNEWSSIFNFIITWRKGFLFRIWIKPPVIDGFEIIVRIGGCIV